MAEILIDPETGLPVQEVKPGSEGDPFTANPGGGSAQPTSGNPVAAPQEPPGSTGGGAGTGGAPVEPTEPTPPPEEPKVETPTEPPPLEGEELQAALERLDTFLEEHTKERVDAARREVQSASDARFASFERKAQEQAEALRQQVRELQVHGLSDEEKAALKATWEIEDERTRLAKIAEELDETARGLHVAALLKEYGDYGVEEEDLEDLTPEEMQVFCAEAKAAYFEEMAKKGAAAVQQPQQPAQSQPTSTPAGARVSSDVGGGGGGATPPAFDSSPTREAMAKNLSGMPWQSAPKQ